MKHLFVSFSIIVIALFPRSLYAAPTGATASDCANRWCSQELSAFEGEIVTDVSFLTWINLDHFELMRSVTFSRGEAFAVDAITRSVENLYLRDIFRHIETRVQRSDEGLRVQFVLTPTLRISEVSFSGNVRLSDTALRRSAGVRSGNLVDLIQLNRAKTKLLEKYREEGFYTAEISLRMEESVLEPLVSATFDIAEGPRSDISKIEIIGSLPSDVANIAETVRSYGEGLPASSEVVERLRWETLLALRKEGYIQASVEPGRRMYHALSGDVELSLRVAARSPVTFYFEGNSYLSDEQLLEPLQLETRRVPFSPSAILSLREDIVKLYQSAGYYFAKAEQRAETKIQRRTGYQIDIIEGEVWEFANVTFSGNETLDDEELLELIQSRPNSGFLSSVWARKYLVDAVVESDRRAIEQAYSAIGQRGTRVEIAVESLPEQRLGLEFIVRESTPRTIQRVEVVWDSLLPESGVLSTASADLLSIYPKYNTEEEYTEQRVESERRRLEERARALGFPNARVSARYVEDEEILRFSVAAGKPIQIGSIWLQGNNYTHDDVILRELTLKEGDSWSLEEISRTQRALYGLGFFRRVEIGPLDGALDDAVEDLRVRVLERDTGSLSAGVAFTTEDGLNLSGELAQRNLFGWGSGLILGVNGFFKSGNEVFDAGRIRAAYVRPRFFELPIDFSLEAFLQTNITLVDQFSTDRAGVGAAWRFGILEDLRGAVSLTVFRERLFDVEEDIIIASTDTGSTFYSMLETRFEFDRRDNVYNPRQGSRSEVILGLAAEAFGSEEDFFLANLSQSFYIPLGKRWVWSNRFAGDYIRPFGDTEVVPLGQRVFLGGRRSLRGYSRNAIGPRGLLGNVAGGDSSLNVQSELRYDFTDSVAGVLFLDAGQAFLLEAGSFAGQRQNLGDFRFSPGFGVHYKTPIGPLSAEVGIATDRENGERLGRFNLGIGTAF